MAPLILGVQRFSVSAGLASNKSTFQTGVADGMGWASGKFGLLGSPPPSPSASTTDPSIQNATGRRLQKSKGGQSDEGSQRDEDEAGSLEALNEQLLTLGIIVSFVLTLQLLLQVVWTHWKNRKYYAFLEASRASTRAIVLLKGKVAQPPFAPIPGVFVHPNLLSMALGIFVTGLAESSAGVLADNELECGMQCRWPALVVLIGVALFLTSAFTQLFHFYRHFARSATRFQPAP